MARYEVWQGHGSQPACIEHARNAKVPMEASNGSGPYHVATSRPRCLGDRGEIGGDWIAVGGEGFSFEDGGVEESGTSGRDDAAQNWFGEKYVGVILGLELADGLNEWFGCESCNYMLLKSTSLFQVQVG